MRAPERRTGGAAGSSLPSEHHRSLSGSDVRLLAAGAALTAASGLTRYLPVGPVAPFVVSAVALAVLAALVGRAVDRLSDRLTPGATGVVQSTLGNLPELFFGIFALRAGMVTVLENALVGSVVASVLLVMGTAFVAGGLRHGTQRFAAEDARMMSLLLLLAVAVLIIPTVSGHLHTAAAAHEQALSYVAASALLLVYALSLPASFRGHGPDAGRDAKAAPGGRTWPLRLTLVVLAVASAGAAFVSDWFVASLSPALTTLHISPAFAGFVIVAVAGNAVEHVAGVQLAATGRPDHALSVILQSPVQIALALIPVLVLASHGLGGAVLSLSLPIPLVAVLGVTAVVAVAAVFDGESTWLEGAALLALYAVVAASFWWG